MKLAMVFPGQGSQSAGMLQSFAGSAPVRETFAEAAEVLNQDLWALATDGPVAELNSTVNTQPLMLAAGYAIYRAWRDAGGNEPAIVAGHSLGEYTALVVAGVIAFRDALPLVRLRAQAMQDAVPLGSGAMAAILGLDDDAVRAVCAEAAQGEIVEAVNFNAPSQVVIAGHKAAVERAAALTKTKGAKRAVMLPMTVRAHSSLMRPAADRLRERFASVTIRPPRAPVIQNVDVVSYSDPAAIKDALARQLYGPVRWIETIKALADFGAIEIIECGPGKVLVGLNKRIDERVKALAITDQASLDAVKTTLLG